MGSSKWLYILILAISASCSKFDDFDDHDDFHELEPEDLETDLLVLNFDVNQLEFNNMYYNPTQDIEVDAELEAYRNGEEIMDDEEVEIEIKGRTTNEASLKSLGVEFEDHFDNTDRKLLNPKTILPHHNIDEIEAFRLRNSGNDLGKTMLKDLSYSQLAIEAGLDVDAMYGEPVVVFVNENFLGVLNLRTETNHDGITHLVQEDVHEITLVEIFQKGIVIPKKGDLGFIESYFDAIEEGDLDYVKEHTDLNSFIDYVFFESFVANRDWPFNNARLYTFNEEKFRFIMFDFDFCNTMHLDKEPWHFIHPQDPDHIDNPITKLFDLLYTDSEFKANYEQRYDELLNSGLFTASRFNAIVDENAKRIEELMDIQIQQHKLPASKAEWYLELEVLKDHYEKRLRHFE